MEAVLRPFKSNVCWNSHNFVLIFRHYSEWIEHILLWKSARGIEGRGSEGVRFLYQSICGVGTNVHYNVYAGGMVLESHLGHLHGHFGWYVHYGLLTLRDSESDSDSLWDLKNNWVPIPFPIPVPSHWNALGKESESETESEWESCNVNEP